VICFELQCSEELQTAHTTIFPYTIDGVPFWMRYYMGAAVGTTAAGSPTAGSCTGSRFNLIYSPTCCETCLDKCDISAELSKMFENT